MQQTNYTLDEKLQGKDLYGLPCRVPEPTPEQAKCSHSRTEWIETKWEDWDGEYHYDNEQIETDLCEDIPGTNNTKCTRCGYTRRY